MSTSVLFAPLCLSLAISVRKADLRNRADAAEVESSSFDSQYRYSPGVKAGFLKKADVRKFDISPNTAGTNFPISDHRFFTVKRCAY
jgi:hypothetical protein